MKKLGIVITDGVGFHKFEVTSLLKQFDKVTIYSGLPISAFPTKLIEMVDIRELTVLRNLSLTWF
jgi:hypothetical protein